MAVAASRTGKTSPRPAAQVLPRYLAECRDLVIDEIRCIVPDDNQRSGGLYSLMLDYPLREGKALRPALCIATCRALGGSLAAVIRSAAVLELYHNAFLIHDDVEDGSEVRRNGATLHRIHGVPIAVNVGDGMLALTLPPLLDNMRLMGMGRALRVLEEIAEMARQSAEGQMLELDWIRRRNYVPDERAYARMVHKKSSWYSFITPMTVGAIAAAAPESLLVKLRRLATLIGFAFQVQDDVLNLAGTEEVYGKEIDGDLWEGKLTLMLIHALASTSERDRARALRILNKPRRPCRPAGSPDALAARIEQLHASGDLSSPGRTRLLRVLHSTEKSGGWKTAADIAFLRELIERHRGVEVAWEAAQRRSRRAARTFEEICREVPPSIHRDFLSEVVGYVVTRAR
jgi:geranylgeranyl diphosphate synthase type II